jgi:hypothetical protein
MPKISMTTGEGAMDDKRKVKKRGHTSKRISVTIDADVWGFLGQIAVGERSRVINEALRAWATQRRRGDAAREMDALRPKMPNISSEELARWVRDERTRRC